MRPWHPPGDEVPRDPALVQPPRLPPRPPIPGPLRGANPRRHRVRRRPAARDPPPRLRARQDELRAYGIPIEAIPAPDEGGPPSYQLRTRDFSLPYLALRAEGRTKAPRKSDKYRYQWLPTLSFEADELAAYAEAASRLRDLGDPLMAEHAESAVRKLACDLPLDAAAAPCTRVVQARARPDPELFATIGDAVYRRRRLTYTYHRMGSDTVGERTVEPLGLFLRTVTGSWTSSRRYSAAWRT